MAENIEFEDESYAVEEESSVYEEEGIDDDDDEEREEVFVYDGNCQIVNLAPNSRKVKSNVPLIKRRGKRGSYYIKNSEKRSKSRYDHQTGFRRKMAQYCTSTGDHVVIIFYQSTQKRSILKYSTNLKYVERKETRSISTQTEDIPTEEANLPLTSQSTPSQSTSSQSTPSQSTPHSTIDFTQEVLSTPSKRARKSMPINDPNVCAKCHIKYGTRMDETYDSVWIKCESKKCQHWCHTKCLRLHVKNEAIFSESVNYFCKTHDPAKLPRAKK